MSVRGGQDEPVSRVARFLMHDTLRNDLPMLNMVMSGTATGSGGGLTPVITGQNCLDFFSHGSCTGARGGSVVVYKRLAGDNGSVDLNAVNGILKKYADSINSGKRNNAVELLKTLRTNHGVVINSNNKTWKVVTTEVGKTLQTVEDRKTEKMRVEAERNEAARLVEAERNEAARLVENAANAVWLIWNTTKAESEREKKKNRGGGGRGGRGGEEACHNCGQIGHIKANCPQNGDETALGEGKRGGGPTRGPVETPTTKKTYEKKTALNEETQKLIDEAPELLGQLGETYRKLDDVLEGIDEELFNELIGRKKSIKEYYDRINTTLSTNGVGKPDAWESIDYQYDYKLKELLYEGAQMIATIEWIEKFNELYGANMGTKLKAYQQEWTDFQGRVIGARSALIEKAEGEFKPGDHPLVPQTSNDTPLKINEYEKKLIDNDGVYGLNISHHTKIGQMIYVKYSKSWNNWETAMKEMPELAVTNATNTDETSKTYYVIDGTNVMHKTNPKYGLTVRHGETSPTHGPVIVVLQHNLLEELKIGTSQKLEAIKEGVTDFYHRLALYHGYKYSVQFVCIQFVDCNDAVPPDKFPCFNYNGGGKSMCNIKKRNGNHPTDMIHQICEYDDYVLMHIKKYIESAEGGPPSRSVEIVTGDTTLLNVTEGTVELIDKTMALMNGRLSIRLFEVATQSIEAQHPTAP